MLRFAQHDSVSHSTHFPLSFRAFPFVIPNAVRNPYPKWILYYNVGFYFPFETLTLLLRMT
jgi:hypothetical protein